VGEAYADAFVATYWSLPFNHHRFLPHPVTEEVKQAVREALSS
jgi:hypothetical protein